MKKILASITAKQVAPNLTKVSVNLDGIPEADQKKILDGIPAGLDEYSLRLLLRRISTYCMIHDEPMGKFIQ